MSKQDMTKYEFAEAGFKYPLFPYTQKTATVDDYGEVVDIQDLKRLAGEDMVAYNTEIEPFIQQSMSQTTHAFHCILRQANQTEQEFGTFGPVSHVVN